MPTTQVTYVRKAEGECRFLTRQEMLHVRSLPELRYGPGKFYDYALNFVGPAVDPEKLDRLQRIAAGLTIAQWEARK